MSYYISILVNYKNNNNISYSKNLLYDIGNNCNSKSIYEDYDLEGVNKYIKNNTESLIFEFDTSENAINFINFVKSIIKNNNSLTLEYVYHDNNILFCCKKYLNHINTNLCDKEKIIKVMDDNRKNKYYSKLYNAIL